VDACRISVSAFDRFAETYAGIVPDAGWINPLAKKTTLEDARGSAIVTLENVWLPLDSGRDTQADSKPEFIEVAQQMQTGRCLKVVDTLRNAQTASLFMLLALGWWASGGAAVAQGPSYACDKVEAGSIEDMICKDSGLSALDRKLAGVYAETSKKAADEHPPVRKAEQRGWVKGRDDCWKSDDKKRCVEDEYQRRIAALQARYRLVPGTGPFRYVCDGNPRNEVTVTFFRTDPLTLIAERGDSVSLMYLQPGASGAGYQGRNETFREHQGETRITWGYDAPEMRCKKTTAPPDKGARAQGSQR